MYSAILGFLGFSWNMANYLTQISRTALYNEYCISLHWNHSIHISYMNHTYIYICSIDIRCLQYSFIYGSIGLRKDRQHLFLCTIESSSDHSCSWKWTLDHGHFTVQQKWAKNKHQLDKKSWLFSGFLLCCFEDLTSSTQDMEAGLHPRLSSVVNNMNSFNS